MSVNHFPYLPTVTNPENNLCIQTVIRIATKSYSFVYWPIANLPRKFHANPFGGFCSQLLTTQTDKRRRSHILDGGHNDGNNDDGAADDTVMQTAVM